MKTLKNVLIATILIAQSDLFAQDYDKVYFNSKWMVTSLDSAIYYRVSGFNSSLPSYDGDVVDYYLKTNQIEMTGHYTNGVKNGEFSFYYPNGKLRLLTKFDNNSRIGAWEEFFKNGHTKAKVIYDGEKEIILELNDSLGNSIIDDNKFRYRFVYFDVSRFLFESNSLKDETIEIIGNVFENLRDGKWSIKKNSEPYASLTYKNGVLIKGYFLVDNQRTVLTNNLAFPLIIDPFKFQMTENFSLSQGAVIKNNFVTEGLHQHKYKSMKKIKLANYEDLVAYINNNFDLRSRKNIEKINIIIKIKNGAIDDFQTVPKMSKTSEDDLRLLLGTIESVKFITADTVIIEYTREVDETIGRN
ncbi:MAG: hypothetical protein RIB47_14700 [Cyclobacteriaceae bacterium]